MVKQLLALAMVCITAAAQAQSYPLPTNVAPSYTTKQTRTLTGEPGKNYWQNSADYDLHINFDPATRLLEGTETIVYTNNSPDTLRQIVFKLYPNLYKRNSLRMTTISEEDFGDGVSIDTMQLDGRQVSSAQRRIAGTNMTVRLPQSMVPGSHIQFTYGWHYTLN